MATLRTYVVLRMSRNGSEPVFGYLGEVEATTHHTARNRAEDKFDLDVGLEEQTGVVVVPKTSWHTYGV